jgi:recombination protein RecT
MTPTSTAVALVAPATQTLAKQKPKPSVIDTIKAEISSPKFMADLEMCLPKFMTKERQARILMTIVTKNPKLAECSRASLYSCMMDCSSLGLEPDGRMAHLIPFGETCTLIVDYKGLVQLIMRSEQVDSIWAFNTYRNEKIKITYGTKPDIQHEPLTDGSDRGEYIGTYAVALLKGESTPKFEWMQKSEIEGIRSRSKTPNKGPWVTDFGEMARKTTIRRIAKTLPLAYEIRELIDLDTKNEFGDPEIERRFRAAKPAQVATTTPAERQIPESTTSASDDGDLGPVGFAPITNSSSKPIETPTQTAEPAASTQEQQVSQAPDETTLAGKLSRLCKDNGIHESKFASWSAAKWHFSVTENVAEVCEIAEKKAKLILDNWEAMVPELKKFSA